MSITINGIEFTSKASLDKYVSCVLNSYNDGQLLSRTDKDFIVALIIKHPRCVEKIGCGIKDIVVRKDLVWKRNKQFWIIHKDGSSIDFSYKKCVFGETSLIDMFRHACRTAIAEDIVNFKMAYLENNPCCPYTGERLTKTNSHVDHVIPLTFNVIVDGFIKGNDIKLDNVEIIGELQRRFKDNDVAKKFKEFHNSIALLKLVSAEANQTYCKTGKVNQ